MASGVLCKVEYQGDIRRFHLSPCTLDALHSNLRLIFSFDDSTLLRLAYADSDGDFVTIYSDQELITAFSSSKTSPPSLRLVLLPSTTPLFAKAPAPAPVRPAFWCNQCNGSFFATDLRYKCGNCADFDLCAVCERNHSHDASHILLKLTPQAQALHGRFPSDKPILPATFSSGPKPTPAAAPIDLGSIFQSVASFAQSAQSAQPHQQQSPLASIFSALQGLEGLQGFQPPAAAPTSAPPSRPDLSTLLSGLDLSGLDLNKLLGAANSFDLNSLLGQLPLSTQTPSAPPQPPTQPPTQPPAFDNMSELRQA